MSDRTEPPRPDLGGAGLVALAAACFGTLGPLSRFAGDAGVDSLTLVTWRAALFIEESLFRGTQWVVFEPNDEPLWAQIRLNIGAF
ncbi:MAG TPA: phage tail protein, partial [Candidatus Limnocylindria bacterium]|nr:phage tail protein [Candidatus Limnocylindria bacterium]